MSNGRTFCTPSSLEGSELYISRELQNLGLPPLQLDKINELQSQVDLLNSFYFLLERHNTDKQVMIRRRNYLLN